MASEPEPVSALSEREEAGTEFSTNEEYAEEIDIEQHETDDYGEDYTPLSSNEDPENQRQYKEYRRLERDIKYQNEMLENLKLQIQKMSDKPCLTRSERNDLKTLKDNWEQELQKLRCLIEKAIHLQNYGSKRHYREFPLITTFDEDNLNLTMRTCETLQTQTKTQNRRASGGESSEMDRSCSYRESQMSVAEERKLMKEICAALKECNNLKECRLHKKQQSPAGKEKDDSMDRINNKINCMQQTISKLKEELKKRNAQASCCGSCNKNETNKKSTAMTPSSGLDTLMCLGKKSEKTENFEQLKENYLYLLTEFSKKDEQLKDLTKKLKSSCANCSSNNADSNIQGNADESELILLRNRINEMNEEQVEFKCLMREQSVQLDDYRNKYLTAQQKVEEQAALLEKLNMNNKRIEKQINLEVKEIRAKFQEKLAELLHFPRLLENEQIKLAQTCKEKEELETKLVIVCKELKKLKTKTQDNNSEDCKPQLQRCQQELGHVKKTLEEIQKQRDMFCEQLRTTMDDLNTLRSESAKIIARTKERADVIKQQQQDQIDRLEKQLAQCRATACLSVSDRESVIREMQGQLNTLSYSFDAAQKQIKTLRNHIAFMSNENSFPAKC
ncbi:outer dense fiber protein 2 [Lucilia cuprina]|uniref:outer dense fiber protein 2 n=1 Tax=Lucilia cuprina TaxID=7375 RepID=UPI001F062343|nr:outer dense fiber protein 2 [Lucilia cuprina]